MRTSHGITAARLREADQPIRRQISPAERLQILDEVYQVRQEEENLLDGRTGMRMRKDRIRQASPLQQANACREEGQAKVWISCANLPDNAGSSAASHHKSSRASTPSDKNSSRSSSGTPGAATDALAGDTSQMMLTPGTTVPGESSSSSSSINHPLQRPFTNMEIEQADTSTQSIFMDPAGPFPISPRDVKRKREGTESSYPDNLTVPPYLPPSHSYTQQIPMSQYSGHYVFQPPPPEGEGLGEAMEDCDYPYFFHY